jgi:hypothetical protein
VEHGATVTAAKDPRSHTQDAASTQRHRRTAACARRGAAGEGVRLQIRAIGLLGRRWKKASELGLNVAVEFTGWNFDMPSF